MSDREYDRLSNGYSELLNRTSELNSAEGNTGFYSPLTSTLDFEKTGDGNMEAVLKQTYQFRTYTGGGSARVITETKRTGITFEKKEGNLVSTQLQGN